MDYLLKAIKNLRPTCSFGVEDTYESLIWMCDEHEPPSKEEVEKEIIRLKEEYKNTQYQRDRKENYPTVEEQLDMLYHDILNDTLKSGQWVHKISSIKSNYPKK